MYRKAIAAFALVASAAGAYAQSADKSGWYAGFDLGKSRLGAQGSDLDSAFANQGIGTSTSIDRSSTAYGMSGGYQFNQNFAVEAALARLGDWSYSASAGSDTIGGKYKINAYSLSAVGLYPLTPAWSLYGKAGVAETKVDLSASSASGLTPVSDESKSRAGLLVGAGVKYDIDRTYYARAGWDRYANVGDSTTGKGPVDLYSVGFGIRF
jgi:OOP family OmpA-OmpF porin